MIRDSPCICKNVQRVQSKCGHNYSKDSFELIPGDVFLTYTGIGCSRLYHSCPDLPYDYTERCTRNECPKEGGITAFYYTD